MADRRFLKLTIPNDVSFLPIAQKCVREVSIMFGFAGEDIYKIELALEEGITNIIKHAFESSEQNTFDIICEKIPLGIKIVLKEKGIPYDPKQVPEFSPLSDASPDNTGGLGTFLLKKSMDVVSFHNLGNEGKETHLIKYLPAKNIKDYFPASELAVEAPIKEMPAVITEKIEYDVRPMQPHESIEISKGAYKSHGYTFFDEHIYYPDQIVEMNKTGELVSVVAVTKDRKFMGHVALHYPEPESPVAEYTFVFVNPEYRGQGCLKRLTDCLFELPQKRLLGIYSYSVANHPFTQKTILKCGFNDCGIQLATSPATWEFKGIDSDSTQRISVVLGYKYTKKPEPVNIYAPQAHKEIIEKLYKNIGAENKYVNPAGAGPTFETKESSINTRIYATEETAEIFVIKYGSNVVNEIKIILKELCLRHIASITLFLNLEDPNTYFMAPQIEGLNFFFSGILPKTKNGDSLVFQYLNNVKLDYDKIVAYSELAKEILDYIKKRDPNAA
ncbi:MAG TPA: ATP-binding protein [Candidatus Wallbacteria bacterium]|nr:MAG: Serine-protein kinase RsbW [bacterium ADurb.Bin243]HPG56414.1 ATP-binding protein [Candidatus Wallbacteria bacterium]